MYILKFAKLCPPPRSRTPRVVPVLTSFEVDGRPLLPVLVCRALSHPHLPPPPLNDDDDPTGDDGLDSLHICPFLLLSVGSWSPSCSCLIHVIPLADSTTPLLTGRIKNFPHHRLLTIIFHRIIALIFFVVILLIILFYLSFILKTPEFFFIFQRISDSRFTPEFFLFFKEFLLHDSREFVILKNNWPNLLGLCHFPLNTNLQASTKGQTDRRIDRQTDRLIRVGLGNLFGSSR